jgi:hypothetical protein
MQMAQTGIPEAEKACTSMKEIHGGNLQYPLDENLFLHVPSIDELPYIMGMVFDMCVKLEEFDSVEFDAHELMDDIKNEAFKIVCVVDRDKIVAMGLLKVIAMARGQRKMFIVGAVGFEELGKEKCVDILYLMEELAIQSRCVRLEWVGRMGWEKMFKGMGMKVRSMIIDEVGQYGR